MPICRDSATKSGSASSTTRLSEGDAIELKRAEREYLARNLVRRAVGSRARRLYFVVGLVFVYTVLVFSLGYLLHRSAVPVDRATARIWATAAGVPNWVKANVWRPRVETLAIDINHTDYMMLAYQRELALAQSIRVATDDEFVPATIRYDGRQIRVRMRLKGDFLDHLDTKKWSFRIRVRGDDTILGMRQFSIQHPKTRNYINEWFYHQALRREGLVALRYDFVKVILNGKNLGIYALEEHFDKRLVENSRQREGPIVRFNETLKWAEVAQQGFSPPVRRNGNSAFPSMNVDTYQTNSTVTDSALYAQHSRAVQLLEAFRAGELTTSDVFDVDKLARFYALADLIGSQHSTFLGNLRFYYNPVTSRLEPIGFDGDSGRPITALGAHRGADTGPALAGALFGDRSFFTEYVAALERVAGASYLNELLRETEDELRRKLSILRLEFPDVRLNEDNFRRNQRYIRSVLSPVKGLHAYYRSASSETVQVQLANIQSMPIEILGATYADSVPLDPESTPILDGMKPLPQARYVPNSYLPEPLTYQVVPFRIPDTLFWSTEMTLGLKVQYRLLGAETIREAEVFPWPIVRNGFENDDLVGRESNVHTFDFLRVDDTDRTISVMPGSWRLDRSMIVPEGYRLIAGEGTRLNLSNEARIISYAPVRLVGSEKNPVVIESADSTGQGLVVLSASERSILEYVTFSNLSNPAQNGWELTGAVTFYESPVSVSRTTFAGSRSEDALNVIRSEFFIEESRFLGSSFDAIDLDFSRGAIRQTSFVDSGNDGIDASGSVLELDDIVVDGSGDKGLSVGERSQVVGDLLAIRNAFIGIASKDLSEVRVLRVEISQAHTGLTAYVKKSEFGPGILDVQRLQMRSVTTPYLVERGSSLLVDGRTIADNQTQVFLILYPEEADVGDGTR